MSERQLSPSDIERIESLLATFIAKAIIGGRLTGKESETERIVAGIGEDDVLVPDGVGDLVTHH